MALKQRLHRLTASHAELDAERRREFSASVPGAIPIAEAKPRDEITIAGEVASVRIVPKRDGAAWLEATVTDGSGSLVLVWTGRRKIAGLTPGKRLVVSGRASAAGPHRRLLMFNPRYELL